MCSVYSPIYTKVKHLRECNRIKNWVCGGQFIKSTKQSNKSASESHLGVEC